MHTRPAKMYELLIAAFLSVMVWTVPARSAELLMLEQAGCHWCQRWNDDIGGVYHKTVEGRQAPLKRIDIHAPVPEQFGGLTLGKFTPTFVLWHEGAEIGRIRGYGGEDFFWPLLNQMLEKVSNNALN